MPDLKPEFNDWLTRFERAGFFERVALVGGSAVRGVANAIDTVLDRAASTVVAAEDAFRKELDPTVSDATIIEEIEERPEKRRGG